MDDRLLKRGIGFVALALLAIAPSGGAQDRLKSMPGYDQFTRMSAQRAGAVKSGGVVGAWADSGKAFDYTLDGKRYRYDVAANRIADAPPLPVAVTPAPGGRAGSGRERGRQDTEALSPDGKRKAVYEDRRDDRRALVHGA